MGNHKNMAAGFDGFIIGIGLILAIGAQNVYVLNQGLKRHYAFVAAGVSALCDSVLIALGAGGLGTLLAANETVQSVARYGGAAFVIGYGFYSLYQATRSKEDSFAMADRRPISRRRAGAFRDRRQCRVDHMVFLPGLWCAADRAIIQETGGSPDF
jgi:arginine exporter protein ArgO